MTKDNSGSLRCIGGCKNCFQWGHCVFCHNCKQYVASSYVEKFYKFPLWLSHLEFDAFEKRAVSE